MSLVRLGVSAAVGALLVVVSVYLIVRAWRMERDRDPGLEPSGNASGTLPIPTST